MKITKIEETTETNNTRNGKLVQKWGLVGQQVCC